LNGLVVAAAMLVMLAATPTVALAGPWVPPAGAQSAGLGGGTFNCYVWTVTVPGAIVPDGGAVHCGSYNPSVAPPGNGYALLFHTMNINIYDNGGGWIIAWNPALTFCTAYTDAELYQAGGDVNRFAILNAAIPGSWREITA